MRRIRRAGTKPELIVRRILFRAGVRYRCLNVNLPGSPDIANRAGRWAIFVHGCFWHGHRNCRAATLPKRNREFWREKIAANRLRDTRKLRALKARGFHVTIVWECRVKKMERAPSVRDIAFLKTATRRPSRRARAT